MAILITVCLKLAAHYSRSSLRCNPQNKYRHRKGAFFTVNCSKLYSGEYTVGSGILAISKPCRRNWQESHKPHALPSASGE